MVGRDAADAGSSCRRRRSPGRDHALRISVLREEPDLVVVQRQRVWVEVLGLCGRCPQSPRGVPEVGEGLALHFPLVPPEAPVAKVECLVRKNQDAESLLPGRNIGTTHAQCARAHDWAEHRVVLTDVGVRPAKRRRPILVPLRLRRAANLSHTQRDRRARPRSACSEPHTRLRSARGQARRRRATEASARPRERGSGECARNDHHASGENAAKRDEYIEQTETRTLPFAERGRTIVLRRGIRISSFASSGRSKSSGASEYSRPVVRNNARSSASSSCTRTSPSRASDSSRSSGVMLPRRRSTRS